MSRKNSRTHKQTNHSRPPRRSILVAATVLLAGAWLVVPGALHQAEAHTRITTDLTWASEIRALLRAHCMRCHSPGGIAPEYVDLTTYGTDSAPGARAWATAIEEELMTGRMPPWQADERYDQFENTRALTQLERDMIVAWVQGGAPQGPKRDLPPPPEFSTEPWELGTPEAVVELPEVFVLEADQKNAVARHTTTIEIEEDAWVTGLEFRPDAAHSVARASAWVIDDHLEPEALEVEIQVPYDPFADEDAPEPTRMRPMPAGKRFLGQWLHGDRPILFPDGAGKRLRKGSRVELVVEYERSETEAVGSPIRDRTRLGIFLNATEDEVEKVIEQAAVTSTGTATGDPEKKKKKRRKRQSRDEEPAAAALTHRAQLELSENTRLIGLNPDLPDNTKSVEVRALYPDQRSVTLLYVPEYDPRWPASYRFDRELDAPAGTRVEILSTLEGDIEEEPELIVDYVIDDHLVLPEIFEPPTQAESDRRGGMMVNIFDNDGSLDLPVDPKAALPGAATQTAPSAADPNAAAHMDHSPLHGGQFFMASNMYHHLEGTLPAPGVFRLYVYDDFKQPVDPRNFAGKVVFETYDEDSGEFSEEEFAMVPVAGSDYLEGRIKQELPAEFFASVWLAGKQNRYDFYFEELTEEPAYVPSSNISSTPVTGDHSHERPPIRIPNDGKGIVVELAKRSERLEAQIENGEWRTLYVPAFDSRDLAEALLERLSGLSSRDTGASRRAISKIMQGAVELDRAGDLADPARARKAYDRYLEGVTTLVDIFR